jgi:CO/xanthine dehydrogenase Mo-binding subunit
MAAADGATGDGKARYFGRPLERREDNRLVTGREQYLDDLVVPGALEAALVRSPFAHARIGSIDVSASLALPGVRLVVTGEDLERDTDPISQIIEGYSQYPLAVGKVRYAGEPVAFVVADDRYAAEDGADLVRVEYEPLPVVADRDAALPATSSSTTPRTPTSPITRCSSSAISTRPSQTPITWSSGRSFGAGAAASRSTRTAQSRFTKATAATRSTRIHRSRESSMRSSRSR